MSSQSGSRKRSEAILSRLLETYLPDERQKVSKKRAKKATSTRRNKKLLRIRHETDQDELNPEKKQMKLKEARKKNIDTLKSWEAEDEINEIKARVCLMIVL